MPFRPLAEAVLGELRRGGLPDLPELRPFRPALGRLVPEWRPRQPLAGAESLVVLEYLAGERVLCLATLRPEEGAAGRELAAALAEAAGPGPRSPGPAGATRWCRPGCGRSG